MKGGKQEGRGVIRLPRLTREELAALGDRPVLVQAEDQQWWDSLDHDARRSVSETAARELIARNLARGTGDGLEIDGRVRFILGARSAPAWLLVAEAATTLRAYGPGGKDAGGVLLEHRAVAGIFTYAGSHTGVAAEAVANFLLRVPEEGPELRRLELFRPGEIDAPTRRALAVTPTETRMAVVDPDLTIGEYHPVDFAALAAAIDELIR